MNYVALFFWVVGGVVVLCLVLIAVEIIRDWRSPEQRARSQTEAAARDAARRERWDEHLRKRRERRERGERGERRRDDTG